MIRYRIKQETRDQGIWTSATFEAHTTHEVKQAVVAGFIAGEARWAETDDGIIPDDDDE